jgi:hypothetical protein
VVKDRDHPLQFCRQKINSTFQIPRQYEFMFTLSEVSVNREPACKSGREQRKTRLKDYIFHLGFSAAQRLA